MDRKPQSSHAQRRDIADPIDLYGPLWRAAAAEGDRSENAEYIYRKRELAGLDRRIRYLQVRMPTLKVIRQTPDNESQIFFAAWVKLVDEHDQEYEYRIVGPDEIDQHEAYISVDSPLAKALMKKTIDDEVLVETPKASVNYTVFKVSYE